MSKSLGNSIEPQDIIKESGAEILRLWVAMSDYREEVRLGKQILAAGGRGVPQDPQHLPLPAGQPLRLRPGDRPRAARPAQEVDRYAAGALRATSARAMLDAPTATYDFPTIFQAVNQLATVDLSAFYADVSKDRLYTFAARSPERRSAQTAMYVIADGLARLLAPILPLTADELWRHLPGSARGVGAHGASSRPTPSSTRCSTPT